MEQEEKTQEVANDNVTKVDLSGFKSKDDPSIIKVDLTKPPVKEEENAVREQSTDEVPVRDEPEASEEVQAENVETTNEQPAREETTEQVQDEAPPAKANDLKLPENVDKLINFMNETGGNINDYVKLNTNVDELDNMSALQQYYKQTKPHLNNEEITFMLDDQFSYEEDIDEETDIKRKKLALKEQVAEAKAYLDGQKSKYYDEIKARPAPNDEYQKAMDFFNRYNKESQEQDEQQKKQTENFMQKTNEVFNDKFEGFDFKVGDRSLKFKVNDAEKIKTTQSDINNFVGKFLDENEAMSDAEGYHKSLFTAMNADAIANHFYEQGKADALKNSVAKSKNIDMSPRQSHGEVEVGGVKYKVLQGDSSRDFKVRIKKGRK
jgi:hypothetical protein